MYNRSRFEKDFAFQSMNGIGQLIIECIDSFPTTYEDYVSDKIKYKKNLQIPMRALCIKFQEKRRVATFIAKAIFNGDEVNYLTVKHENIFHVFYNKDVVKVFEDKSEIVNSKARRASEMDDQKVLFRFDNKNIGELEIRNSGSNHYKEVLFVMNKLKVIDLLFSQIKPTSNFNDKVVLYGLARKRFGNWVKK